MSGLDNIDNIVLLMLENRSFDQTLGFLYDADNPPPRDQSFEGLTGNETNPDQNGQPVKVFKITPDMPDAYYMPGSDPGEGYYATNIQLFGAKQAPPSAPAPAAANQGFVISFAQTLAQHANNPRWTTKPGTTASSIMGMFTPQMLPIMSGLAKGYAVSDRWFASAPTETLPNRAFAGAATSQGHLDDTTKLFTSGSIFSALSKKGQTWAIYGYNQEPYARQNFPDITDAQDANFGQFKDFQDAAAAGKLAAFTFLEPSWSEVGNSQHPVGNVALGEQLIHDVYYALRNSPQWNQTLLIVTYDEHGGNFDHVPPPWTAVRPDDSVGEFGFGFDRFGVRVPAVFVSPWIEAGTVIRASGQTPFDHTSILRTVELRWGLDPLSERDKAAPDLGGLFTAAAARPGGDDPIAGVAVPVAAPSSPPSGAPNKLQQGFAELTARLPATNAAGGLDDEMPELHSSQDYDNYIRSKTAAWHISKRRP
ncbi:MAG TPA: alkaline phosphatase family protein [Caulobacteraceae bacterium]|nr:alkaline phosphatase family protein [Caulobacteraceae bacterium]